MSFKHPIAASLPVPKSPTNKRTRVWFTLAKMQSSLWRIPECLYWTRCPPISGWRRQSSAPDSIATERFPRFLGRSRHLLRPLGRHLHAYPKHFAMRSQMCGRFGEPTGRRCISISLPPDGNGTAVGATGPSSPGSVNQMAELTLRKAAAIGSGIILGREKGRSRSLRHRQSTSIIATASSCYQNCRTARLRNANLPLWTRCVKSVSRFQKSGEMSSALLSCRRRLQRVMSLTGLRVLGGVRYAARFCRI